MFSPKFPLHPSFNNGTKTTVIIGLDGVTRALEIVPDPSRSPSFFEVTLFAVLKGTGRTIMPTIITCTDFEYPIRLGYPGDRVNLSFAYGKWRVEEELIYSPYGWTHDRSNLVPFVHVDSIKRRARFRIPSLRNGWYASLSIGGVNLERFEATVIDRDHYISLDKRFTPGTEYTYAVQYFPRKATSPVGDATTGSFVTPGKNRYAFIWKEGKAYFTPTSYNTPIPVRGFLDNREYEINEIEKTVCDVEANTFTRFD